MDRRMLEKISESFSDGENIAKSATNMAIQRSQDLNMNPAMTLLILKVICEIAIEDYREHFTDKHPLGQLEKEIGIFAEMEKMVNRTIREEFKQVKAKGG